jgi:STAS domain
MLRASTRPVRLSPDLAGVTHCDSAGLHTLLGICQALDPTGITVTITAAGPAVLRAIHHRTPEERLPLQAVLDGLRPPAQEPAGAFLP